MPACGPKSGFTLLEVLAVAAILGILAAIALPAFLGEQDKGHDADAKSNARNVIAAVESCFTETRDYTSCDTHGRPRGGRHEAGRRADRHDREEEGRRLGDRDSGHLHDRRLFEERHRVRGREGQRGETTRTCTSPGRWRLHHAAAASGS